ncbi:MAG: hypothetical protein HOM97_13735 [Nitrospina sp.]|jgi:hypothetical protein|nr:hypothetical protein [Nitrospina sp.]
MKVTKIFRDIRKILKLSKSNKKFKFPDTLLLNIYLGIMSFRRAEKLTQSAFYFSAFWIFVIVATSIFRENPIWSLELNNLGDYLAGTFAPLAVLWFIIGYFQQGKELQLQRQELALQRQEFNFLGKQAERQADTDERRAILEENANKPILVFEQANTTNTGIDTDIKLTIKFSNKGGPALNAEVTSTLGDIIDLKLVPTNNFYEDSESFYIIEFTTKNIAQLPIPITLDYSGSNQQLYRHKGFLSKDKTDNVAFFNAQKLIYSITVDASRGKEKGRNG